MKKLTGSVLREKKRMHKLINSKNGIHKRTNFNIIFFPY